MEACFAARFPREGTRRGAPSAQEFITKAIQELQEARTIHGDCRLPPGVAPHPGEDGGLRVCIDILGLNRAASQERFWPSRVGRCEGPPHSYVRMPLGLPSVASTYQRNMRRVLAAQETGTMPSWRRWRWSSGNLPSPQSLLTLKGPVAREEQPLRRVPSAAPTSLPQQNQVTFSKFI